MLRNCPDSYYNNCSGAGILCKRCPAGSGAPKAKLLYSPLDPPIAENLEQHPYSQSQKRIVIQRRARATERKVEREIITGTLRSGAALGDGDHLILGEIRQEVKDRGPRNSWNLTWKEYTKGRRQGVQVYAISIEPLAAGEPRRTMYMMEAELFTHLLAQQ